MLRLPEYTIAGVDYGSKLAGTTVLAVSDAAGEVRFYSSRKGKDADAMLKEQILALQPRRVFIDAPLSLPGVYRQLVGCNDYFFRQADQELRAMSPMFLGGLTARAIQLKDYFHPQRIQFVETYPGGWVRQFSPEMSGYKDKSTDPEYFSLKIVESLPLFFRKESIQNWHHADALIALVSGLRYENQQHTIFGSTPEGEVVI